MVDFEKKLVNLIVEWKRCFDFESSQVVTCRLGVHIGFLDKMPLKPEELSSENRHRILELIDQNYEAAYNAAKKVVAVVI